MPKNVSIRMSRRISRRTAILGLAAMAGSTLARAQQAATPRQDPAGTAAPDDRPRRQAGLPPEQIRHERVEQFLLGSSRHAGEPWRIHVAWPQEKPPARGCPVIHLLDGNASFPLAWHALQAIQRSDPQGAARQVVLVGIGYPANVRFDVERRYFDLTPPTASEHLRGGRSAIRTGGQDIFLDFIEHDLRPAIARRVAVDMRRQALFGHSLGGLLALHALYTRPRMFDTWIAADPSIWWNGGSILHEEAAFLAGVRAAGDRLAQPSRLLIERSSEQSKQQQTGTGEPGPDILDSARRLARIDGLEVFFHRFADESHPSMLGPSIHDGLRFFLGNAPAHLQRV
ncbi:alpha/beta hydrolase [Pseudothauera rhizosphaerae]|uniref:Alpha/beta hydrolase n=1 Tax=Pseudothauera rhizosphaerae TaxID=2565932 RepID=A0A4S4AQI4_9RHOO|nr:alpha/beta hydrolase-fold protein [Pseudothauera rhizosphaerae]THF60704.1 alpha/beta hydrolase [Pseudothauera rhizosphaerae]